ncbi:MAG: helix-hairpin-helix domain-containing protein [Propionibacteriaceae bacterium]|nr:helix-hairpin-helix domain-containing protein [Propionibacteriaceae bacterium]
MKNLSPADTYVGRLHTLFPSLGESEESSPEPSTRENIAAHAPRRAVESLPARFKRFGVEHVKVLSTMALVAVIFTTWMVMSARAVPLETMEPEDMVTMATPEVPTEEHKWLIHVLGAVANPGVVAVESDARVIDAIAAAGGLTPDADPGELNLAALLSDGCQVFIGTRANPLGEVRYGPGDVVVSGTGGAVSGSSTVNLNRATQAELETLPGVGPVTAQAILAWRDQHGSFTSTSQLQEVKGIGSKTFSQLEPYVSV